MILADSRMQTRTLWKLAYAAAVLGTVSYGVAQYHGVNGVAGVRARQKEVADLAAENARLREDVDRKLQRIERLTTSPVEQELEIRKRLKFVKPDEKVYILQDGKPEAKPGS